MKKISLADKKRILDLTGEVGFHTNSLTAFLDSMRSEFERHWNAIEDARSELEGVIEDCINEGQEFYDNKSESWQEGHPEYQDWLTRMEEIKQDMAIEIGLNFEEPCTQLPAVDRPDWIDELPDEFPFGGPL